MNGDRICAVTGGSGFIGHHLVHLLLEQGYRVRVLDLLHRQTLDPRAHFIEGSILDRHKLDEAFAGAHYVFHLAADPNLWAVDPEHFETVNHQGTRRVLEAAGRAGAERIVHTSTESILKGCRRGGAGAIDEAAERALDDMPGPYCRSKFLAEEAALDAARRGLPVVVVNPTLPVGPGDMRLTPPSRMILDFINGKNPAYLDFEMNMIDVRDAALGHYLAARRGGVGERYILGGENLVMAQVLLILREITGLDMPDARIPYWLALAVAHVSEFIADHVTRRAPRASVTGVRIAGGRMLFDCSKARDDLGLAPRPARLAIADAVAWFAQRGYLARDLSIHRKPADRRRSSALPRGGVPA